jgi:hypothetical protein
LVGAREDHRPRRIQEYNDAARAIWHEYPRNVLARGGRYINELLLVERVTEPQ